MKNIYGFNLSKLSEYMRWLYKVGLQELDKEFLDEMFLVDSLSADSYFAKAHYGHSVRMETDEDGCFVKDEFLYKVLVEVLQMGINSIEYSTKITDKDKLDLVRLLGCKVSYYLFLTNEIGTVDERKIVNLHLQNKDKGDVDIFKGTAYEKGYLNEKHDVRFVLDMVDYKAITTYGNNTYE